MQLCLYKWHIYVKIDNFNVKKYIFLLFKRFLLNWIQVENPETKIFFIISWLAKSDSIFGEEGVRL